MSSNSFASSRGTSQVLPPPASAVQEMPLVTDSRLRGAAQPVLPGTRSAQSRRRKGPAAVVVD